MLLLHNKDQR